VDLQRLKIDRAGTQARPASRRRSFPIGKLIALALVLGAAFLFRRPLTAFVERYTLPEVETARIVKRSLAAAGAVSGASSNGYVVARVKAALSADTPGRIVELNVEEGMRVPKGFVVARLYADEYQAALEVAAADVAAARSTLEREVAARDTAAADRDRLAAAVDAASAAITEAEAERKLWTLQLQRYRDMVASGAENQRALDEAEATFAATVARVESAIANRASAVAEKAQADARVKEQESLIAVARAGVTLREAARDQAAATLDKTIIRAPFDGIVVLKDAEVGEVVSPNVQVGANARGSVATMVDFESLEIQAEVPEATIARVEQDQLAMVFLDAYPDRGYRARVDRIWPTANRQKATIEVRAELLERDDRLRPEMGCRIVFGAEPEVASNGAEPGSAEPKDAPPRLYVPADAVIRRGDRAAVFVLEGEVAVRREVVLGERSGEQFKVLDGLVEGDHVIRRPPPDFEGGERVRRKDAK
jgi:RND family efflux transporter MFP subunit